MFFAYFCGAFFAFAMIYITPLELNSFLISESFGPTPNTFRSDYSCLLLSNFIDYDW